MTTENIQPPPTLAEAPGGRVSSGPSLGEGANAVSDYYLGCMKRDEDRKRCKICGEYTLTLFILESLGRQRVNPFCKSCQAEHEMDAEQLDALVADMTRASSSPND